MCEKFSAEDDWIVITSAMVRAGVAAFEDCQGSYAPSGLVEVVYRAMVQEAPSVFPCISHESQ